MTVIRRSIGLLTAIGLGLLFPTIAYGVEISTPEVSSPEVNTEANRWVTASVDIEERLEPVDGRIDFEQTNNCSKVPKVFFFFFFSAVQICQRNKTDYI